MRFAIDASALTFDAGGSLAVSGPTSTSARSAPRETLGHGCFGRVVSMLWNGSPVAVKELNGSAHGDSLGTEVGLCV